MHLIARFAGLPYFALTKTNFVLGKKGEYDKATD